MPSEIDRPTVLTREAQAKILQYLREGNYLKVACTAAGFTYDCFNYWEKLCENGAEHAQVYADFFHSCKAAVAAAETDSLANIRTGASGWQGSAWFLERRYPRRWGRKETVTIRKGDDFDPSTLTDEQLREVARGKGKGRN